MKTLLVAINAKYIHSNLAVRYLKAVCDEACGEVLIFEHSINESVDKIIAGIVEKKPDIVAFSCYIWNIELVFKAIPVLRKLLPGLNVVLGGPEVSFNTEEIFKKSEEIDYIVAGEGETAFKKLLSVLNNEYLPEAEKLKINGVYCGKGFDDDNKEKKENVVKELDLLPSPFDNDFFESNHGKIVYIETTRGCPYNCSYCLSSADSGVRSFSEGRVKADLKRIVSAGAKTIKFVDRTFNFHIKRAMSIMNYIIEVTRDMDCRERPVFHFEIAGELFNEI